MSATEIEKLAQKGVALLHAGYPPRQPTVLHRCANTQVCDLLLDIQMHAGGLKGTRPRRGFQPMVDGIDYDSSEQ